MIATTETNATTALVLTPQEAAALLQLLDQAVQQAQPVEGANVLLTALDKLDDAASIARWLRENTTCELTLPESHAVAELVQGQLANEEDLPDIPRATLSKVSEKVGPCFARQACR